MNIFAREIFPEDYLRDKEIGTVNPKHASGCAIKIDLRGTIYPALEELKPLLEKKGFEFNSREDAYTFKTKGKPEIHRRIYQTFDERIAEDINEINPDAVISLISLGRESNIKNSFKDKMLNFYEQASRAKKRFIIGKGHSILASHSKEQEFLLQDYIKVEEGDLYGAANNDTIQIVDHFLKPSAEPQIYIALNNALNDILLKGITDNIEIHPVFDSLNDDYIEDIRKSLKSYARFTGFEVREYEPLNLGIQVLGATVTGVADVLPPSNSGLKVNDEIYLTRPIGDLIFLNGYLVKRYMKEEPGEIGDLRRYIINLLSEPNIEAAKVIREFRPRSSEDFDEELHVSATRDVTGEGILSLVELAEDSKVTVYMENLPLHNEDIISGLQNDIYMSNATAGTNGAILIGGKHQVMENVVERLKKADYRPEYVGRVVGNGQAKVITNKKTKNLIDKLLRENSNMFEVS